ncbi:hypothetical protein PybrP1_002688 [[Pythium] brassicae (nom. inval.)]|nr:hypothetical protein PybrP1_002688 [[Pythium] brassicae (nom. inval.)]
MQLNELSRRCERVLTPSGYATAWCRARSSASASSVASCFSSSVCRKQPTQCGTGTVLYHAVASDLTWHSTCRYRPESKRAFASSSGELPCAAAADDRSVQNAAKASSAVVCCWYWSTGAASCCWPRGLLCAAATGGCRVLLMLLAERCRARGGVRRAVYLRAYGVSKHIISPYKGTNLAAQELDLNRAVSSVREAVEWTFGRMKTLWAAIDFAKQHKLMLSPVGTTVKIAMLPTNCHCCYYRGNQISMHLGSNLHS